MFDCVLNTSLSGFYIFKADKRHTMSTILHCTKQQVPVTSFLVNVNKSPICSHLLKKSFTENFIFCAVLVCSILEM